jgi:hypothetical protein
MVNAGRILILAKGNWSNLVNYEQLDLVTRGDIAYLARQASVGVDPATDTQMTYWQPFGSAAKIADTSTPGLVMPDGTTITIDTTTGLIQASLGIADLTDVVINNVADGSVLRYDLATQKWKNVVLGTAALKDSTGSVTQGSTDVLESAGAYSALALKANTADLATVATSGDYDDLTDKPTIPAATSISYTGTASATGVRYQRVGIGTAYTEIDGTKYMEQTKTLSTSAATTYTFTNAAITADSVIIPVGSIFGIIPSNITTSAGSCVVTIPKHNTAVSLKVRIYIR